MKNNFASKGDVSLRNGKRYGSYKKRFHGLGQNSQVSNLWFLITENFIKFPNFSL